MLRKVTSLLLLCCFLFVAPRTSNACGPFFLEAVFTYSKHPDLPLDSFARGQIGVLQPTYARSYLVAAYRHLQGVGFNREEQAALLSLWKERLDYSWESGAGDSLTTWNKARAQVEGVGAPPEVEVFRAQESYDFFLNCPGDAFLNAATTLNERIKKFGAGDERVKDWVRAQDTVFSNCNTGQNIPETAASGSDAIVRADRTYQIAAANFYSLQFDEARGMFEEIARDASTPWRRLAPYLAARALVRKASLGDKANRDALLTEAEQRLRDVLADGNLSESHMAARRLLRLVRLRLHPGEMLPELSAALMVKDSQSSLRRDLWDYTYLLDELSPDEDDESDTSQDAPRRGANDSLTDWVLTFQAKDDAAREHSVEEWEKTSSQTWLVAAISKVSGGHEKAGALVTAAGQIAPESPAFAAAVHHGVRLLIEQGKIDEARARLDEILARQRKLLSPSTLNLILSQRMHLARSADEFLTFAQRVPAGLSYDYDGREIPDDPEELAKDPTFKEFAHGRPMFDRDAARVLNVAFPLSVLKSAALSRVLPVHLRREVAVAAWVRSVLLDDRQAGKELTPVLLELAPELRGFLDDESSQKSNDARKFSALYAILKFPGTQPYVDFGIGRTTSLAEMDSYRDNWWCSLQQESLAAGSETSTSLEYPSFLNPAQRQQAERERARLATLGAGPNYLARMAVVWAQKTPNDPRVPEALHLAVKSTRYGCSDKETGAFSKAAFDILHRKYPSSPWAKKTPYWFKGV